MAVYKSSKPTKDGRSYFFRIKYKDIFGESHDYTSPKFISKKEAINAEASYRIKIQNKEINTSNVTIKEIYDNWILEEKKKVKEQTISDFNSLFKLLSPIQNTKINNFNLKKYKEFVNYLESKKFSIGYSNRILKLLKKLIKYSNKYYNTNDNILKFITYFKNTNELPKEMLFFTYEEYKKFDQAISNFEHHVFFEILYFLGLRIGECLALTWNDIDFENNCINITKTLTTKIKGKTWSFSSPKTKGSIRTLPITTKLKTDLFTMLNDAKKYSDFKSSWLIFGKIKPLNIVTITNNKNKYCQLANVKQIRIHDFRHSCASLLINQKASIALVSKYLGHSSITITLNTYTHMYKNELEEMTKILNNL